MSVIVLSQTFWKWYEFLFYNFSEHVTSSSWNSHNCVPFFLISLSRRKAILMKRESSVLDMFHIARTNPHSIMTFGFSSSLIASPAQLATLGWPVWMEWSNKSLLYVRNRNSLSLKTTRVPTSAERTLLRAWCVLSVYVTTRPYSVKRHLHIPTYGCKLLRL